MPLRDHFHPPLTNKSRWDALYGGWPAVIVQKMNESLPAGFAGGPLVHLGFLSEQALDSYEQDEPLSSAITGKSRGPSALDVGAELPDYDAYEVRVYEDRQDRQLVAAIELVSPANKDLLERRSAIVAKCAAWLRSGVSVTIVDVVTTRQFNLYHELMKFIGCLDPTISENPPGIYAASCRWIEGESRSHLQSWSHPLAIGEPLPTLPLWLSESLVIRLDLEQSYEQACRDLRIA